MQASSANDSNRCIQRGLRVAPQRGILCQPSTRSAAQRQRSGESHEAGNARTRAAKVKGASQHRLLKPPSV